MNRIQYISVTHTSKDMAKEHKRKCNTLHTVYYKEATFDEVADLLDAGCSIGRVGNTTDFVAIDIDKTSINISTVIERYKDNSDYRISYSASNNPLKYHILVNLHRTIHRDEYKNVVAEEFEKIKSELCTRPDYMVLDKNADNFYQCFFGASVDTESEYILEVSKRLYNWTKKDAEPRPYIEKEVKEHPSLNSADYCRKNGLMTIKEERRFDIYLPSMTGGKLKIIDEGNRYHWCRMTGTKLLLRILYLNQAFNEGWTKFDFLETFEWIVRSNVVKFDEFEGDYKNLSLWLDNKWDIVCELPYETQVEKLEPYFNCAKRQYKSRKYNPTTMKNLILEHWVDKNNVLFTDKEELHKICKELMIDYYRFLSFAKSVNYNVVFECESDGRAKRRGRCLDGYEVVDNTVSIPREEVTNAIKMYCSRHNIKIVRV